MSTTRVIEYFRQQKASVVAGSVRFTFDIENNFKQTGKCGNHAFIPCSHIIYTIHTFKLKRRCDSKKTHD